MAIRSWSFTRFWTVSAFLWLLAATISDWGGYYRSIGLLAAILGFAPAFLAGSWAGEHPEIAHWPRVRLITMWFVILFAILAVNDATHEWHAALLVIGAPAAIFTLRWYELTAASHRIEAVSPPPREIPPTTPPEGSTIG